MATVQEGVLYALRGITPRDIHEDELLEFVRKLWDLESTPPRALTTALRKLEVANQVRNTGQGHWKVRDA